MKKIALLFIGALVLTSCGSDKKSDDKKDTVVEVKDKYIVEVDGIFEKNDELTVYCQKQGYYDYDNPLKKQVTGSTASQHVQFDIPENVQLENIILIPSTNKEQAYITISNISIKKNDSLVVNGANYQHNNFFNTDGSFTWDEKNQRFNLNHGNANPPAISGKDTVPGMLSK